MLIHLVVLPAVMSVSAEHVPDRAEWFAILEVLVSQIDSPSGQHSIDLEENDMSSSMISPGSL